MSHREFGIGSGWFGDWLVKFSPNEITSCLHVFSPCLQVL